MDRINLEHKVQEWRQKRAEKMAMRLQINADKKRSVSGLVLGMIHDKIVQLPTPPFTKSNPDVRIPPVPPMRKSLSSGDIHQRRKTLHGVIINHDPNHYNQHQQELYSSPHYNRQEFCVKSSFSEPRRSIAAQKFRRNYNNSGSRSSNLQCHTTFGSGFGFDKSAKKRVLLSGKTPKTPVASAFRNKSLVTKNNPKSVHFHDDVKFTMTPEKAFEILPTSETEENLNGTFIVDEDQDQINSTTHESSNNKTSVVESHLDPSPANLTIDEPPTEISCCNCTMNQLNNSVVSDGNTAANCKPNPLMDVNQSGLLDSVQIVETIEVVTSEESDIKNLTNNSFVLAETNEHTNATFELSEAVQTVEEKRFDTVGVEIVVSSSSENTQHFKENNATFELTETNEHNNATFELTETNEHNNATFELTETNEHNNATFELTETNERNNTTFELTETNEHNNATFELTETNERNNATFELTETNEHNNATFESTITNGHKNHTFESSETNELKDSRFELPEGAQPAEEKHFNNTQVKIVVSSSSENMDENTQHFKENTHPRIQGQTTPLKNDVAKGEGKATIRAGDEDLTEKLDNMFITPVRSCRKSRALLDTTNIVESSSISFVEVKSKADQKGGVVLLTPVRRSTRKKPVTPGPQEERRREAKIVPNPFLNLAEGL